MVSTESGEDHSTQKKILAIFEVVIVRFVIYSLLAMGLLFLIFGTPTPSTFTIEASYIIGLLWFIIPGIMIFVVSSWIKQGASRET